MQERRADIAGCMAMPGIRWQPPQPYCLINSIPRLKSPEKFAGPFSDFASQPARNRQARASADTAAHGAVRMVRVLVPQCGFRDIRILKVSGFSRSAVHIRPVRLVS